MHRSRGRWLAAAAVSSVIAAAVSPAFGQAPSTQTAPSVTSDSDPTDPSYICILRDPLSREDNYDAALVELERAYEVAPSYKLLYDMGRVQRAQNNYAALRLRRVVERLPRALEEARLCRHR